MYYFEDTFSISEFKKGIHKKVLSKNDIKILAKKVKKLHSIKLKTKKYDFKKDLIRYEKALKDKHSKTLISNIKKAYKKLAKYKTQHALIHHDLNPLNILFYNQNLVILDWEFAQINDIFFDLATICIEFDLNKKQKTYLLKNYFKKTKKFHFKKLKLFSKIYKSLCILWFREFSPRG